VVKQVYLYSPFLFCFGGYTHSPIFVGYAWVFFYTVMSFNEASEDTGFHCFLLCCLSVAVLDVSCLRLSDSWIRFFFLIFFFIPFDCSSSSRIDHPRTSFLPLGAASPQQLGYGNKHTLVPIHYASPDLDQYQSRQQPLNPPCEIHPATFTLQDCLQAQPDSHRY